ncbi:MAG TPA: hypothetical protein VEW26_06560 [Allosphingosinicella sp.]|nr:hypothetical protein [Allosphingosinicella sp.]
MPTRYQQLRQAIANLAAPAEEQAAYLDRIFEPLTGGGSAAGYGNDELALELDDIYGAAGHMLEYGEITPAEIEAARPLNELLLHWSGQRNADFWTREALFGDPRWDEVRGCASRCLASFPDEERSGGWKP